MERAAHSTRQALAYAGVTALISLPVMMIIYTWVAG